MNEAFNPYREWLGLDGDLEAPHFYQLVGVAPFEDDQARLVTAVDKALVRVRGFRPGPRAAAWAKLLDELAQAKACFQDPAKKSAYDDDLRRRRTSPGPNLVPRDAAPQIAAVNLSPDLYPPGMAPKPPASAAPASSAAAGVTVSQTRNPYPPGMAPVFDGVPATPAPATQPRPQPPASAGAGPGVPAAGSKSETSAVSAVREPVPPGPVNAHVAPPRKPRPSLVPLAAAITGVVIVATLIILYVALHDDAAGSAPSAGVPRPAPVPTAPAPKAPASDASTVQPSRPVFPVAPRPGANTVPPTTTGPVAPPAGQLLKVPDASASPIILPDTPVTPPPTDHAPNTASADNGSTDTPEASTPPPPAASLPPDPALGRVLVQAQSAIADRQFRDVDRALKQADSLANSPEHQALVKRVRRLGQSAEQFWAMVATAMRRLKAAQELTIGSAADRVVIVVETGPDSITIHNQGRNEKYTLATMPAGLALAIARSAVDVNDVQTLVLFGACAATVKDRQPNHVEEARRYWEQAKLRGADVDDLLATLTDKYDR